MAVKTAEPKRWDAVVYSVLAALILVGVILRISNLDVTVRSPDEKVYTAQARSALEDGVAGTRRVVESFRNNPQAWLYPPPSRIGYLYLLAATMKFVRIADESAGSYLSCLASILTMLITVRLGLRFFGGWITVFAIMLLAVFPPELVIARRCWTDAPVELVAIVIVYLTLEIRAGSTNWWPLVLLPLAGSIAVLIKETTVLVYGLCLLAAFWALLRLHRDLRRAAILAAGTVLGAIAATVLLAYCTGGLAVPFQIMIDQAKHNAQNSYALEYCSGPAYLLPWAFASLSPFTFVLGMVGLVLAFVHLNVEDRAGAVLLAIITIAITAPYALVPHWLNVRYASASFALLCLFAAAALYQLLAFTWAKLNREPAMWVTAGVIAVAIVFAAGDYQRFQRNFGRVQTMDLSVKMVFDVLNQPEP